MLLALHLGRLKDEGRLAPEHVSIGKLANVNAALTSRAPRGRCSAPTASRSSTR